MLNPPTSDQLVRGRGGSTAICLSSLSPSVLSLSLYIYIYIYIYICIYIYIMCTSLSLSISICPSVCPSVYLSVLSLSLSQSAAWDLIDFGECGGDAHIDMVCDSMPSAPSRQRFSSWVARFCLCGRQLHVLCCLFVRSFVCLLG